MSKAGMGFKYTITHRHKGVVVSVEEQHNLIPIEGLNYIGEGILRAGAQPLAIYAGLYKAAHTPTPADEMATFPSIAVEQTNYVSATRPVVTLGAFSNGEADNTAAKIVFTGTMGGETAAGGFVATSSAKGSTVGPLLSAVRFPSPKDLTPDDDIELTVVFSMVSV